MDLRQKVLKASLALIGEEGLDRFSMREVARKAGVSHQAPYHHFGDREAILAALAAEGFAKLKASMDGALSGLDSSSVAAVGAIAKAYVDFALVHPAYFQVMFRSDAVQLDNYPIAKQQANATFECLTSTVDTAFAGRDAQARRRIALGCWALTHGLATLFLDGKLAGRTGAPKSQQRHVADQVIETFTGLLARSNA